MNQKNAITEMYQAVFMYIRLKGCRPYGREGDNMFGFYHLLLRKLHFTDEGAAIATIMAGMVVLFGIGALFALLVGALTGQELEINILKSGSLCAVAGAMVFQGIRLYKME